MVRKVVCALSVLVFAATHAWAAEFHAVVTNFGNAPRASAHLDVSVDTAAIAGGSVDVLFDVYRADGTLIAEFSVPTNEDGFASSASATAPNQNLFRLSGGEPALVRARTPQGGTSATATLQQRGRGSRLLVSVPPDREVGGAPAHVGQRFPIHVGDMRGMATASIIVANVSSSDAAVDVFVGRAGASGAGKYTNPRLQVRNTWRIDLQPDDENTHLILSSDVDVIVQLVVDDGRLNAVTVLPAVGG